MRSKKLAKRQKRPNPVEYTNRFFGPLWWGWGLAALLMTLYATVTSWPLTPFLVACFGLSLFGYARHWPSHAEWLATGRLLFFGLPFIWAWSHNEVFMWDDFAHRLPSLLFVDTFDSLPTHSLPPSLSFFPSYPYALTVLGLAVNRLMGSYTELSIAMLNGAFLIAFAGMLATLFTPKNTIPGWRLLAVGVTLAAVLNPAFTANLVASAYQDATLGIALAVAFILLRPILTTTALPTRQEALALGLTLALVTGLKQVGLVLAVMVVTPVLLLLAYRLRRNLPQAALLSILLTAPILAIWLLWRAYVAANIGGGEFAFFPFAQWHWNLLPEMAASLGKTAIKKPFAVLPLLAVSAFTVMAFRRRSRLAPQRLCLLLASLVGWGYFAFLMLTYIGSFGAYEAGKLASFSRYMQHVNWLLWVAFLCAVHAFPLPRLLNRPHLKTIFANAPFLLVAVPLVAAHEYTGKLNAEGRQMHALALALPAYLPAGHNLLVRLDEPTGSGFRGNALQYYAGYRYRIQKGATSFGAGETTPPADAILTVTTPETPPNLSICTGTLCTAPIPVPLP